MQYCMYTLYWTYPRNQFAKQAIDLTVWNIVTVLVVVLDSRYSHAIIKAPVLCHPSPHHVVPYHSHVALS